MSKYTTEIKTIVESYTYEYSNLSLSKRIDLALPKIFNFDYPIWDESYRRKLERKIIMHYINKEIGVETVGLWKFYLEERLNLIMPFYNEMYKTTTKEYDWLTDTSIVENYTANENNLIKSKDNFSGENTDNTTENYIGNSNEESESNSNKNTKSLKSDLPQSTFSGADYGTESEEIESDDTSTGSGSSNSKSDTTRNNKTNSVSNTDTERDSKTDNTFEKIRMGSSGSKSLTELMLEYRNSLINIDKMVVDELYDLFMLIY